MDFEKDYFDTHYGDASAKNSTRKLSFLLKTLQKYKKRGKLLDVGFGYGSFLKYAQRSFDVYGVDFSSYTVQRMQQHVKTVKEGRAENIPFGNDFFDLVTLLDVLEHVPHLEKALAECRRVLKKDGILFLLLPVYDGISGPFIRLLDNDKTHIHKYSRRFWLKKMKEEGFTLLAWGGIFRYLFFKSYYFHLPTVSLRDHAPAIFMVCRKT